MPRDLTETDERPAVTYPLATSTWGEEEAEAIREVVASDRMTQGERVRAFERAFADSVGSRHAVMVNSGSSANLLAVAALCYRKEGALAPGDQVLVPAVSWGTTLYPIHQYGMELRFVDVEPAAFNIDPDRVEAAITPATRALFVTDLMGALCDYQRLQEICERRGLLLLEDACEALGARSGDRKAGTFGVVGTFSTYFSHHISTVEGGVVVTDDDEIHQLLTVLRSHGWSRDLPVENLVHPKATDPFHDLFCFVLPGYNLRSTEIAAAMGLCQLEKLDGFLAARQANAELYLELFGDLEDVRVQRPSGTSTWFSFPLVLEARLAGRRDELARYLRAAGVDTRPVLAGDFTKNPVIRHLRHSIAGPLVEAEKLDRDGLLVGNHHYDIAPQLHRLRELIDDFRTSAPGTH